MTHLSLSFLGPFQAWTADGILQPFRTLKERALLAYLAIENDQMHRRETLAELFWPDRPEGIARNNLRQALYGIRQGIGGAGFDQIFSVTNDEVRVNLSEQVWLDMAAFEVHLKAAQQHNHEQSALCPYCIQHLRDAVEMYRGNFLEDVFLDKNSEFQEWIAYRRELYYRMQMQSLEALVTAYERVGDYIQASIFARRQVQLNDLKESLYCKLMILLARTGRANAALEEYETCRRKLREALGSDLDESTVLLSEQICAGKFDPGSETARAIFNNLPEQLTAFVGREMELHKISHALENPAYRLVSLVGLGGVGKTRMAIQAACMNLRLFPDGVYFVPLEPVQLTGQLHDLIGRVIGLAPGADQQMGNLLVDYLRPRQILLVLDGFEYHLERKEQLLEILRGAPYTKILLTTRERLRFQAEFLMELQGLPFPTLAQGEANIKTIEAQSTRSDAVRLLFERASRVRSGQLFANEDPGELSAALRICQLVEGLPLGIELAASWSREYTFAQIAEEVQRNLEFLQNTLQDLPERHRSLQASFEHSWDLLSESECEVFSKLAVFPGSFSRNAAQVIAGAAQPWLMRLEDKSLVQRAGLGRFILHPLLRQYAGQKLRQYSRRIGDLAQQQHAQFFCSYLKERELDLRGFRQAQALDELEMELENINSAWDWAIEHGAYNLIEQASIGMLFFLEERSRWQEGEARFRSALSHLKDDDMDNATQRVKAYLTASLGWFCCRLTRFEEAEKFLQISLEISENQEMEFIRIYVHFALGFLYTWMSRFKDAWLHLSITLSLAERIGDGWGLAWSRELLAEIAFESGQTGFDEKPFLETFALFERVGEQRGSSRALNYLGNIALGQERYKDAQSYFEKLLANVEKLGDVWGAAGGYSKLGQLASARNEYDQAWRLHQRSLAMLQKTGDQRRTAYAMRELGEDAAALNKPADAVNFFQQALEIAARSQNTPLIQDILTGIAGVLFQSPEKERAVELLGVVLQEPIGDKLSANRANRLWDEMRAGLPAEKFKQAQAKSEQSSLKDMMDRLLLDGIQLPF